MRPDEAAVDQLSTRDQFDQVCMRLGERRRARAYLRQAGLLAAMLLRVGADVRRILGYIGRGVGAFARRSKVRAATPEPN